VRDAEPRQAVIFDNLTGAPDGGGVSNAPDHGGDTNVRHDNSATLCLGEQYRVRCVVVHQCTARESGRTMRLTVKVVSPSGIRFLARYVEDYSASATFIIRQARSVTYGGKQGTLRFVT
jgi:hypothetical protein